MGMLQGGEGGSVGRNQRVGLLRQAGIREADQHGGARRAHFKTANS